MFSDNFGTDSSCETTWQIWSHRLIVGYKTGEHFVFFFFGYVTRFRKKKSGAPLMGLAFVYLYFDDTKINERTLIVLHIVTSI